MLNLLLLTVLQFTSFYAPKHAPPSSALNRPTGLTVKIESIKREYAVGEPIQLRLELHNEGKEAVFVGNTIPTYDWLYHVELVVTNGEGKSAGQLHFFNPQISEEPRREPDITALTKSWSVLQPGYFFGTILDLNPQFYDLFKKPGEYWIRATYSCEGIDANLTYNQVARSPEFLAQLPYHSWKGQILSDPVKIRIVSQ